MELLIIAAVLVGLAAMFFIIGKANSQNKTDKAEPVLAVPAEKPARPARAAAKKPAVVAKAKKGTVAKAAAKPAAKAVKASGSARVAKKA